MSSTAHRALHYPDPGDPPDIPADLAALAIALDFDLFVVSGTVRPAAGTLGRVFFNTGTGAFSFDTGTVWIDYLSSVPGGTYLQLAGGTMSGPLDLATQELRNPTVLQARDKTNTQAGATGGITVNAANGAQHLLTLVGNVTSITVSNLNNGESLKLIFVEDATGGRTVAFPAGWVWPGGATATLANFKTTANAVNVVVIEKTSAGVTQAFLAADLKT